MAFFGFGKKQEEKKKEEHASSQQHAAVAPSAQETAPAQQDAPAQEEKKVCSPACGTASPRPAPTSRAA